LRTDFFILADSANAGEGGKALIEGAGIDRVFTSEIPAILDHLAVVIRIAFEQDDKSLAEGKMVLTGPDDGLVAEFKGLKPPAVAAGDALTLILNIANLELPAYGAYRMRLFWGEDEYDSRAFSVSPPPRA
jgi:Family of unknown function (DUF6941)